MANPVMMPPLNLDLPDALETDVAIVGGGCSGVYSGWRLLAGEYTTGSRPASVTIFELSDRFGGRLDSVVLPGMQIAGELGGMRYLSSQEIVTTLIETEFELDYVDFSMGDPATHFFYMRGQRFKADAWTEAQKNDQKFETRYFMNGDDVGFTADQLFNKIIYDVLTKDPWFMQNYGSTVSQTDYWTYDINLTSQDWDAVKPVVRYNFPGSPYDGMRINEFGFWNLIADQVGSEGYEFLSVAGGYYSNTINWNAAESMPNMVGDFTGGTVSYKTISGGYDQICYAVAQAFLEQPGSAAYGEAQLVTFDKLPEGSPRRYRLVFDQRGITRQVFADSIILAMPRRSLELLDQDNFFFNPLMHPELQEAMASTIIQPSFKLLMGFEYPWWKQDFGATAGESITDLPMRQCYYFGTDPDDSHSLFLASYNDMRTVPFWAVLEGHPELFEPRATKFAAMEDLEAIQPFQATRVMVDEAMRQVRELHGMGPEQIPDPYVTWFKDWGEDPFGGGYHAWDARVDVENVMKFMRQPFPDEAIHVVGEAYSDQQGWVEGAFCVAEHLVQDHYGVTWPSWLNPAYYLGW
jgi:monoamine oxidase